MTLTQSNTYSINFEPFPFDFLTSPLTEVHDKTELPRKPFVYFELLIKPNPWRNEDVIEIVSFFHGLDMNVATVRMFEKLAIMLERQHCTDDLIFKLSTGTNRGVCGTYDINRWIEDNSNTNDFSDLYRK